MLVLVNLQEEVRGEFDGVGVKSIVIFDLEKGTGYSGPATGNSLTGNVILSEEVYEVKNEGLISSISSGVSFDVEKSVKKGGGEKYDKVGVVGSLKSSGKLSAFSKSSSDEKVLKFLEGEPGEPIVPVRSMKILIPEDREIVKVKLNLGRPVNVEGDYFFEPSQKAAHFGDEHYTPEELKEKEKIKMTLPKAEIYNANNVYPAVPYDDFVKRD